MNGLSEKCFTMKSQIPTIWFTKHSTLSNTHCVKSVRFQSYSGPHLSRIFPHPDWIRRDTKYEVSLCIQSGCGKMREKCGKNADQNNTEYGHFSRSDYNNSLGQKKLPVTLLFLQKCYDNLFIYSPWKHQKIRGLEMFSGAGWGSKKQAFQTSPGGRGPSLITIEIFLRVFGRIWNWVISA